MRFLEKAKSIFAGKFNRLGFDGASNDRLFADWNPLNVSADADILNDLDKLKARCRQLIMNDPHAAGMMNSFVSNVIGTGLKPQSRLNSEVLKLTPEQVKQWERTFEQVFKVFIKKCDAERKLHFYSRQSQLLRDLFMNGEAIDLPVTIRNRQSAFTSHLMMIDSDRLDTPFDKRSNKGIRRGVELGQHGDPVAYYIKKTHPKDYLLSTSLRSDDYSRIQAFDKNGTPNIFHLYMPVRVGQTRGYPFFAPALRIFRLKGNYMTAEMVKANMAACYAVFIETQDAYGKALLASEGRKDAKKNKPLEKIFPGLIKYLNPGEAVKFSNPNFNAEVYAEFIESMLRAASSSVNMTYEEISKDFSKVNYSSARAALLLARRYYRIIQDWFAKHYCQHIWEMSLWEAYLQKMINPPNFIEKFDFWVNAEWIADGWEWIDPKKEADALVVANKAGMTTLKKIYGDQGRDWEQELEQLALEQKRLKELGITIEQTVTESKDDSNETDR